MKKIIIASDIHGSAEWCGKLLRYCEKIQADRIVLLGDILYHGPRNHLPDEYGPKSVIEMLNAVHDKILCVRGNCDAEVDQMVLNFPIMADYALLEVNGFSICATHGHKYNEKTPPSLRPGDILLYGHTHIPAHFTYAHFTVMNPGSVSLPKNHSPHSFIELDDAGFTWKNLETGEAFIAQSTPA